MSLSRRLAWRNLRRHGRRTWLTVGAMVFCNALLVFMFSLQLGGCAMMIDGTLSALTGHLQAQDSRCNGDPRMRYSAPEGVTRASAVALASSEFGGAGSEYGGLDTPVAGKQLSSGPALFTRIAYYF